MKALLALARGLVLLAAVWSGARGADAAPPIPRAPAHWVTDDAGLLSAATARALDERLRDYERRSGHQVLVYITPAAVAPPVEDWTVRAFARWKVGRKALDDGLVLFVFPRSRTLRIEVGYGLEPVVPDVVAARIIRETIAPGLRAGQPDRAVSAGVERLLATIGGTAPARSAPQGDAVSAPVPLGPLQLVLIGLLLVALLTVAARSPRMALWLLVNIVGRGGFSGGGGFGGGGGFSGGGGRSGGGGASGRW